MTPDQWNKEKSRLQSAVTRAGNKLRAFQGTLMGKLHIVKERDDARAALHAHKLNAHTLITQPATYGRTAKAPVEVAQVVMPPLRGTSIGEAIEQLEEEQKDMESVYVSLRDSNPELSEKLRVLMEAIDLVATEYAAVR